MPKSYEDFVNKGIEPVVEIDEEIPKVICDEEAVTPKDFKEAIVEVAIEKFIDKMYDNYINDKVYSTIKDDAKEIVKTHSKEIIDEVVARVSNEILKKKAIVNEVTKKSEITNINKEWENYFVELIDKAIAKRFK